MLSWMAGVSFAWQTIWLPLATLSSLASGALLAGGFAGRRGAPRLPSVAGDAEMPAAPATPPSDAAPLRLTSEQLDVERELVAAVQGFAGFAADRLIRLEIAIQPGLAVRADRSALRQIIAGPLRSALDRSACGRVLVGAGRHGGRVQISVLDDGIPVDRVVQEAQLRGATRLVALQGGTLDVNVRANAGTTVVIRLLEAAGAPAPAAAPVQTSTPQAVLQGSEAATAE